MANHETTQTPASTVESVANSKRSKFADLLIRAGMVIIGLSVADLVVNLSHQPESLAAVGFGIGMLGVNLKINVVEKEMDMLEGKHTGTSR